MALTFRTSAHKKKFRLKPKEFAQTVGNAVYEAVTNRSKQPDEAEKSAPPSEWEVFPPKAPIMPEPANVTWPMPVERFQYGHFLEPGDVILTTRLESFFAMLSRTFDNSRFAHSALTFVTPRTFPAVDRSYLIEATFGGIDLNAFSDFVLPAKATDKKKKSRYIVGIKRLETDWFTHEMRPLVSGRMLRFIKDDQYNFALLAALAADRSRWFFRIRDFLFGRAPTISDYLKRSQKYAPVEFICSGFVQFAYVDMIAAAVEAGLLAPHVAEKARDDVFFAPWVSPESSMEELMAVKPRELAESHRLQWKYLIYDGLVHKVTTEEEVNEFHDKVNSEKRGWF